MYLQQQRGLVHETPGILNWLTHSSEAIVVNDVRTNMFTEIVHLDAAVGLVQIPPGLYIAVKLSLKVRAYMYS